MMTDYAGTNSNTGTRAANQPPVKPSPVEQAKQLAAAADSLKAQQGAAAADAKAAQIAWDEIVRELDQYEKDYDGLKDLRRAATTRKDDRLLQLGQLIPAADLEVIEQAIKDYDEGPLQQARQAHDHAKTALDQATSSRDQAAAAVETAKQALGALKSLRQDLKTKLQAADALWKEADEKFDNDKFAEAYVLTSEKLKPAVDALPTLRTVPDHRQGLTQAWQTWFDAKTTLREAEDALLRAQRTWDEAKVEYERVQTERVQELLDAVGAPSNPAGRAA